MPKDGVPDRNM